MFTQRSNLPSALAVNEKLHPWLGEALSAELLQLSSLLEEKSKLASFPAYDVSNENPYVRQARALALVPQQVMSLSYGMKIPRPS